MMVDPISCLFPNPAVRPVPAKLVESLHFLHFVPYRDRI